MDSRGSRQSYRLLIFQPLKSFTVAQLGPPSFPVPGTRASRIPGSAIMCVVMAAPARVSLACQCTDVDVDEPFGMRFSPAVGDPIRTTLSVHGIPQPNWHAPRPWLQARAAHPAGPAAASFSKGRSGFQSRLSRKAFMECGHESRPAAHQLYMYAKNGVHVYRSGIRDELSFTCNRKMITCILGSVLSEISPRGSQALGDPVRTTLSVQGIAASLVASGPAAPAGALVLLS